MNEDHLATTTTVDNDLRDRNLDGDVVSTQEDTNSEDHVVEADTGLELNFDSDDDVIREEPDCIKCLVVFAAFGLVTLNFIFTSLHTKSLQFVGTNITARSSFQPSIHSFPKPNFPDYLMPDNRNSTEENATEGALNQPFLLAGNQTLSFRKQGGSQQTSTQVNMGPDFGRSISQQWGSDGVNTPPSVDTDDSYVDPDVVPYGQGGNNISIQVGYDQTNSSSPQGLDKYDLPIGVDPGAIDKFHRANLEDFQARYGAEMQLQKLLFEYYRGNESLVDSITSLLKSLNRSEEVDKLLSRPGLKDVFSAITPADLLPPSQPVADTYGALYGCVGVLSASLILLTDYRVVGVVGSVFTCLSCLGSTFCNTNSVNVLAFLYGALSGIGQNMIIVSATVAILENFSRRRLTALLIPHIGAVLGTFVLDLFGKWLFPVIGLTSWKSYLFLQTGVAGTMILFSGLLFPARLKMRSGGTFISRLFGFNFLQVYKSPLLYSYGAIVFAWEGGLSVIIAKLPSFKGLDLIPFFSVGQLLVGLLLLVSLVGLCINCCVPSYISCRSALILVGVLSILASGQSLLAFLLYRPIYALVYSSALGLFKGLTDPFLEFLVPLLLGEDNIVVGTGVMATSRGISALTMVKLADKIESDMKRVDGCFYLAGILFFLAIPFCYISHRIYRTHKPDSLGSANPETSEVVLASAEPDVIVESPPLFLKNTSIRGRSSPQEEQFNSEEFGPKDELCSSQGCPLQDHCTPNGPGAGSISAL